MCFQATKGSLMDLRTAQQKVTHAWYCKLGQESMNKEVIGHRREHIAIVLQSLSRSLLTASLCMHRLVYLMLLIRDTSFESRQRLK